MIKRIASNQYARIGIFAFLAVLVVVAVVVFLHPAQPAAAAPAPAPNAPLSEWTCTPLNVAVFSTRVHIKCSTSPGSNVYYFAVSNSDSGLASRYLSIFTSALLTGKSVNIWYNPGDNGNAWGCGYSDCRPIWGAALLP